MDPDIQTLINVGEIDINNQDLFMSTLVKAFLNNLEGQIRLRDKKIPCFILNTGDDIMYLEHKGQDFAKEPQQVSNEDYIYNSVPRCIVDMGSIEVLEDQVTSPYGRGNFEITHEDMMYGFNAEFRRMPLKVGITLKYYLDSFTDMLAVSQAIITKMLFIRTYKFDYMGQTIQASYKVPVSFEGEKNITFDGGTTDQKLRIITLNMEVETNMPVFNERTAILNDKFIRKAVYDVKTDGDKEETTPISERDIEIEILLKKIEEYRYKDVELTAILREILMKINKRGFEDGFIRIS